MGTLEIDFRVPSTFHNLYVALTFYLLADILMTKSIGEYDEVNPLSENSAKFILMIMQGQRND